MKTTIINGVEVYPSPAKSLDDYFADDTQRRGVMELDEEELDESDILPEENEEDLTENTHRYVLGPGFDEEEEETAEEIVDDITR